MTRIVATALAVCVGGVLVVAYIYSEFGARNSGAVGLAILEDVAKTCLNLVLIGVIGLGLKQMFQWHQSEQTAQREALALEAEKRAERNKIRRELLNRLVAANHRIRRARLLIPAHGSAKTYGEQMRSIADASLEFQEIEHEIKNLPDLFVNPTDLEKSLGEVHQFLDKFTVEFRERYQWMVALEKDESISRADVLAAIESLPLCSRLINDTDEQFLKNQYLEHYWAVLNSIRGQIRGELGLAQ